MLRDWGFLGATDQIGINGSPVQIEFGFRGITIHGAWELYISNIGFCPTKKINRIYYC